MNDYKSLAKTYAKAQIKETGYLAFRDLPKIILSNCNYTPPSDVLDFGCGAGRSTRFLKSMGCKHVVGVDKSLEMLTCAKEFNDTDIEYLKILDNVIPFDAQSFNYAISTFVMLEIPTLYELLKISKEIMRVLKPGGFYTFLTNSEYLYSKNWLSNSTTYSKDKKFYNGEKVEIYSKNIGKVLYDYYWDNDTYLSILRHAGFIIKNTEFPLGNSEDPYTWLDESTYPPFAIYTGQRPF